MERQIIAVEVAAIAMDKEEVEIPQNLETILPHQIRVGASNNFNNSSNNNKETKLLLKRQMIKLPWPLFLQ